MVQPVFKDIANKEVQVDLGPMEKDGEAGINVYIVSNQKIVPERKRDALIDLIMEVSSEHDDVVLVLGMDEESVSLGPVDKEFGPMPFKIFFQTGKAVEATASKGEKVDLFLKDLFIRIQSLTNNLFSIISYHDHIQYEKKGLCPLNSNNNDLDDDDKNFFSLEEYKEKKSHFPDMVKDLDIKTGVC